MITSVLTMTYLTGLAVIDVIRREVPAKLLHIGTMAAAAYAIWSLVLGKSTWEQLVFGAVPGMVLLSLAVLTRGAGIGDGIVLLQLNLVLCLSNLILAFSVSLIVMSMFAVALLMSKKGKKDMRLPYLPFLWLGCLCTLCLEGPG